MDAPKHSAMAQLWALLWKSWIIRRVHWISSFFELVCPVLFMLIVASSYSNAASGPNNPNGKKNSTLGPIYYDQQNIWEVKYDFRKDFIFNSYNQEFKLFYTPENDLTKKLLSGFPADFIDHDRKVFELIPCANETEMDAQLQSISGFFFTPINAGIYFENTNIEDIKKGNVEYKIKLLAGTFAIEMSTGLFPVKYDQAPIDNTFHAQIYQRFSKYQAYINKEIIKILCEEKKDCVEEYVKPITVYREPYPKYANPKTSQVSFYDFLGIVIIFSYVVFCPLLVKRITDEKCTKARELLRLIGMSDLMYWASHFINNFIVILFHSLFITIFITSLSSPIIVYASWFMIFTFILLFGIQLILFAMTITTVFNRPVIATIVTTLAWMLLGSVILAMLLPNLSMDKSNSVTVLNPIRRLVCLTPMGSIIMFMSQVGEYENFGQALSFANFGKTSSIFGSFTALNTFLLMILSIPIYCFFIWYLDNVWPFQHGVPKPVYYLFQSSYWFPEKHGGMDSEFSDWDKDNHLDPKLFEPVHTSDPAAISVKNVTKEFTSGLGNTKIAVQDMNMNIYPNQITVLLGHNGAGKSTTMNMITGMFKPTSGNVYVHGFDVATQTKSARQSVSLCPQENIIFTELTVSQHLWLFAMLKGSPAGSIHLEIEDVLRLLKLVDKKHEMAVNLSGGMKRKLSLGIALIGNTNTLILDEPTSGMDPDARRVIWDLLLSIRRTKTILITTHYMEEADVLADRIAIMNAGTLGCSGSPYFLKNALGSGYRLRIAKLPGFEADKFLETVQRYIPTAKLMSDVETEVIVSLESELTKNDLMVKLMQLFQDIEKHREFLKVDSTGLSYSTMEDVFLSVGSDLEWNGLNEDRLENEQLELSRAHELNSGATLFFTQLWALLMKRFHYSRRHWLMFIFQLVIPGAIMLLAVITQNFFLNTFTGAKTAHLELSTVDLYGADTQSFYYGSEELLQKQYKSIIENQEKGKLFFSGGNLTKREVDNEVLNSVQDNLKNYIHHYLYGLGVENKTYNIHVNYEQYHSIPLAFNVHFESIIRSILNSDSANLKVISEPLLNSQAKDSLNYLQIVLPWVFTSLIFLPIAFPFLASSYIMFAIEENVSKAKLIQLMTKMSPAVFWMANFIFDLLCHTLAILVLFAIIWIFDSHSVIFAKTANNAGLALFLLMFVFGLSTIPIAYLMSYKFAKPSSGFVFMVIVLFLFGFIFNIFLSLVEFARTFAGATFGDGWYGLILSVVRIVPIFSFLFGYQKVYKLSSLSRLCDLLDVASLNETCSGPNIKGNILQGCCPNCDPCFKDFDPFAMSKYGAGIEVLYMLIGGLLCILAIVLYEVYKVNILSRWNKYLPESGSTNVSGNYNTLELSQSEDQDVERERARLEEAIQNNQDTDIFSVLHLRKNFGGFTAVDDLTFGVKHGECFGLLGVNGAGKTTTFSMLTGDLIPSSGNAFMCEGNYSLVDELKEFQGRIGYCPQFDALLNRITGYETLKLFARLRGIPHHNLLRDIKNLIKMVGLEKHAHKLVGAYSGGNKRKLSIAVALIGNPMVLFLDEPSAGVDPAARRKIWQTLGYLKRNFNCSIILTSHSMEECEALCSRLGIMVNGRFRCLGSTQHLRSRYGQGYSVTISVKKELNDNKEYVDRIQSEMARVFPSAVMKDFHQGLMHYHITDPRERWSNIFTQMVNLNQTLDFEDYNVSDTTLEQIFLMFARHQKPETLGPK